MKSKLLPVAILIICVSAFSLSKKKTPKKINDFVFIPGGSFHFIGKSPRDSVESFYMLNHEITNIEYREFLDDIKLNERSNFDSYQVDSVGWRSKLAYNEVYVENYHRHPAFNYYPVLNVTKDAAKAYCRWMEQKLNQLYGDKLNAKLEVKLPTRIEWEYAARGGLELNVYAWGGPLIRNAKGQVLCCFNGMDAESIVYDYEKKTYVVMDIPSSLGMDNFSYGGPVQTKFYPENAYGLYEMCGNAAEMVQEEGIALGGSWDSPAGNVTVTSTMPFTGSSREVGFRPILVLHPN
jgi:formylglycine-generating enzyme required for sulfatase activity